LGKESVRGEEKGDGKGRNGSLLDMFFLISTGYTIKTDQLVMLQDAPKCSKTHVGASNKIKILTGEKENPGPPPCRPPRLTRHGEGASNTGGRRGQREWGRGGILSNFGLAVLDGSAG